MPWRASQIVAPPDPPTSIPRAISRPIATATTIRGGHQRADGDRIGYRTGMCRSIKTLHRADVPPTDEEISAAALQFVRKVSGYRSPSRANAAAFDAAVEEIAAVSGRLLAELTPRRP